MRSEIAKKYFLDGFNCAQSVLLTFNDLIKTDEKVLLRLASSFGGGMGKMQFTCGAVSGAYMVLGYFFGKTEKEDKKALEKNYMLVREFKDKFTKNFGSENCKELIKCDLLSEEGRKYFIENKIGSTVCANLVVKSVEILEEILNNEKIIS
ncbi:MAG TPA: C-GCAxxG-C-C family protein [Exilispira sp.]|nr:C-GCAxxG-C-C family protein [Exilispira sp.]